MAKTAPKKVKAPPSIHSRSAKRASSPGIDLDKSLKEIKPPTESKPRPSILAVQQGSGISKKLKNGRKSILSAKARRRQEKGLDRAEAFMDKKETKVEKSKGRARTVQERAKAWEEINKKAVEKKAREDAERLEKDNWVDEDEGMDEDENGDEAEKVLPTEVLAQYVPLPDAVEEEEEL